MRNFPVDVLRSLIPLEFITHLAVNGMVHCPYRCALVQPFQSHEILVFRPMTFGGQPQSSFKRFPDFLCFLQVRERILTDFFGYQCRHSVSAVVVSCCVCYRTAVVVECITRPDAGVSVIESIVVGVVIQLLPGKVSGNYRPYFSHIIQITRPIEMPEQFVDVAQIHVVVMHLIGSVWISADISVTVLRRTPFFFRACEVQYTILSRMWDDKRNICHLTGCIIVKMSACAVVPTETITGVCRSPARKLHSPAYCSVKPHLAIPNSISSNGQCSTNRIQIGIRCINYDS